MAEHHGFLMVLLWGLMNDDIMVCGGSGPVKVTFLIIFLDELLVLLLLLPTAGVSLIERVQHLQLGGAYIQLRIKLRGESKRPDLTGVIWGVLYLVR